MSEHIHHVTDANFRMKYLNPACQYWLITGPNGAVL